MKTILIQRLFVLTLLIICNFDAFGQVTDIDGNTYETKKIGDQIWMTENLRTIRFSNGDSIAPIEGESTRKAWKDYILTNGDNASGYMPYKEFSNNDSKEILYNGPAASDNRGLCPKGWHVPTIYDWHKLMLYNGGWVQRVVSCDKGQVTKLKTKTGWSYPASNTSGFSARPSKVLDTQGGLVDANSFFSWASSTNDNTSLMYGIEITDFGCYEIEAFTTDRNAGMPCRCIKGEDLVKWADFTDEETNKFPSTSLKWKTQKYESREEQLEKLNQTQPLNGW